MVVIDASFDDLQNVLTSLGVLELGSQSYMVILLCQGPSETCVGEIKELIKAAKLVVVRRYLSPQLSFGMTRLAIVLNSQMEGRREEALGPTERQRLSVGWSKQSKITLIARSAVEPLHDLLVHVQRLLCLLLRVYDDVRGWEDVRRQFQGSKLRWYAAA